MKLSDIPILEGDKILKDSEISTLGLLNHSGINQFSFIEEEKYISAVGDNITAVITTKEIASLLNRSIGVVVSKDPKYDFYIIHNYLKNNTNFYNADFKSSIDSTTVIHSSANISEINVKIGKNCQIGPNVVILPGTIIGNNSIIMSGSVIGTEGFQFIRHGNEILSIKHAGGVKIGNYVEIMANSCVCNALFQGYTTIGDNTKIDNLVHVAHNATIGNSCLIAANAMIAGSSTLGNNVWIGPSASISSGVIIKDNASVTLGSVVTKTVEIGEKVTGNFAINHKRFIDHIKNIK